MPNPSRGSPLAVGERTSFAPGTFCWVELATTDTAGAKDFYGSLFGWESEDRPAGESSTYTMLSRDGRFVGALFEQPEEQRTYSPPNWLSYVSVENADAIAERATHLGATVGVEPFDVLDSGRMAVIVDPQGATFAVWQPREHHGAQLVNDPGALSLNQLNTSDPGAAQGFYSDLFGWRSEFTGTGDQPYWGLYNGDDLNGGMMALPPGVEAPPHWLAYFTSDDLDASTARIEELGGRVVVPIAPIGVGRIAVAQDPQGAVFALFEGRVDP